MFLRLWTSRYVYIYIYIRVSRPYLIGTIDARLAPQRKHCAPFRNLWTKKPVALMRPQWKTCKWTKQVNKLTYTQSHTCRSNCTSVSSSYRHLMLNLNETMWFKREPWLNLTKLYYTIRWLRLALNNEGRRGCPKATHPKSWGSYTLGVCLGLWFRMSDATEVTRILPKATCAFWWVPELRGFHTTTEKTPWTVTVS